LFKEDYKGEVAKIEVLRDLLPDITENGHRLLIFSQFVGTLKEIEKELVDLGIEYFYIDGNVKSKERMEISKKFNAGQRQVVLISLKAGGTGLNLVGADVVIHYDPWWNVAVENQASDRAYRIGQKKSVQVIKLVTEGTIAEASPSKATSLSIFEMNYLLNKTKVKDVMLRDVITVSKFASLEDATYLMYKNKVGILPVVDNDQVSGVITDRDIFRAFLEVSGYGEEGVRVRFVTEDKVGVLEQIIHLIVEEGYNIANTVNIPTKDDRVVIEVQIDGVTDLEGIRTKFEANGLKVDEIIRTTAKVI